MAQLKTGLGMRLVPADAAAASFAAVPIIDLAALSSPDVAVRQALALQVQAACINVGFFYLTNHGIAPETMAAVFEQARVFFDEPIENKMLIDVKRGTSFKGYLPLKGEQVDPASSGDMHEAINFGTEQSFSGAAAPVGTGNQWPSKESLLEFRTAVEAAWDAILDLGQRLFPLFALALHLPEDHFKPYLQNPGSCMRLLHYPSQEGEIDMKSLGIGAHTDYECFTLLAQDEVPALQVLNSAGEWILAPPIPGAFVCNIGDQLQMWTNDVFKSTVHRAINRTGKERYSIPFFFGSDYDTLIEALPSCVTAERPAKYAPTKAGEWVESRLAATYVVA